MNYYGNGFQGDYDYYYRSVCKEASRPFSRFGLALFLYLLVSNVAVFLISVIVELFAPSLAENVYFVFAMSFLPSYIIALPILYLLVKNLPKVSFTKEKIPLGEFLAIIAVAEALMSFGNAIGIRLNAFIGAIIGSEIENTTSELIMSAPIWLIIVFAVIIGPIVEELIFRKLMLDRLSVAGSWLAIIASSVTFGLFHGNFYQFFYAALLGALLGYVYIRSGNIIYSILLHSLVNFIGSVVVIPVASALERLEKFDEMILAGETVDKMEYTANAMLAYSYTIIQLVLVVIGAVVLFNAFFKRWIRLRNQPTINVPRGKGFSVAFVNVGMLLFFAFTLFTFVITIFASAIPV